MLHAEGPMSVFVLGPRTACLCRLVWKDGSSELETMCDVRQREIFLIFFFLNLFLCLWTLLCLHLCQIKTGVVLLLPVSAESSGSRSRWTTDLWSVKTRVTVTKTKSSIRRRNTFVFFTTHSPSMLLYHRMKCPTPASSHVLLCVMCVINCRFRNLKMLGKKSSKEDRDPRKTGFSRLHIFTWCFCLLTPLKQTNRKINKYWGTLWSWDGKWIWEVASGRCSSFHHLDCPS